MPHPRVSHRWDWVLLSRQLSYYFYFEYDVVVRKGCNKLILASPSSDEGGRTYYTTTMYCTCAGRKMVNDTSNSAKIYEVLRSILLRFAENHLAPLAAAHGVAPRSAVHGRSPPATVAKGGIAHGLVSFISLNHGSTGTPAALKKIVIGHDARP